MDGILNIEKATGMTSHDVVAKVRRLLKQKRVGHTGTLDPAASGVLPICVGQGTRVAEYLSESGKAYQAEITFGVVTDTYDREGTVLRTTNIEGLTLEKIEEALPAFLGAQMQTPPRYSAIKIQGQPAYKRARSGEELILPPRPVEIQQLSILAWNPPHLTLAIDCSKGTYIRSLAYDLGKQLGYGAYLSALIRTRSGPFTLEGSITLEQLAEAIEDERMQEYLYPADYALQMYPAFHLEETTAMRVLHGNTFHLSEQTTQPIPHFARIYDRKGRFIAIAEWQEGQQVWQPKKVFTDA